MSRVGTAPTPPSRSRVDAPRRAAPAARSAASALTSGRGVGSATAPGGRCPLPFRGAPRVACRARALPAFLEDIAVAGARRRAGFGDGPPRVTLRNGTRPLLQGPVRSAPAPGTRAAPRAPAPFAAPEVGGSPRGAERSRRKHIPLPARIPLPVRIPQAAAAAAAGGFLTKSILLENTNRNRPAGFA